MGGARFQRAGFGFQPKPSWTATNIRDRKPGHGRSALPDDGRSITATRPREIHTRTGGLYLAGVDPGGTMPPGNTLEACATRADGYRSFS